MRSFAKIGRPGVGIVNLINAGSMGVISFFKSQGSGQSMSIGDIRNKFTASELSQIRSANPDGFKILINSYEIVQDGGGLVRWGYNGSAFFELADYPDTGGCNPRAPSKWLWVPNTYNELYLTRDGYGGGCDLSSSCSMSFYYLIP